jgi:hypothetical protein
MKRKMKPSLVLVVGLVFGCKAKATTNCRKVAWNEPDGCDLFHHS